LQRQVQVRHQPLLFVQQPPKFSVDLRRVEGGEAQTLQFGHGGK